LSYGPWGPDVTITGVHAQGTITHDRLEARIGRIRASSSIQPRLRERSILRARAGSRIHVEVTLQPLDGTDPIVSTLDLRVPRSARGDRPLRFRGGRDRGWVPAASSLSELIMELNGGEHRNDLIVTGLGHGLSREQSMIVKGAATLTIRAIR
ncbi:MAG TPA: hypothetical protein VE646_12530, partial [Actinomycetota bacterium]|nr:hypothetical protein [Actinomycetota bacterium]